MMKDNTNIKSLLLQQQWEASFFQIVEQYTERLMLCAMNILGDKDTAEDALQEAFISIWKNLHAFKGESQPFTWCYSIVRNSALNELRKAKKLASNGWSATAMESMAGGTSVELRWSADEIHEQLLLILADLPEKQKMVFEMRYFQELSFKELASITGLSEGGLKANYHHARAKVEEKLIGRLNLP